MVRLRFPEGSRGRWVCPVLGPNVDLVASERFVGLDPSVQTPSSLCTHRKPDSEKRTPTSRRTDGRSPCSISRAARAAQECLDLLAQERRGCGDGRDGEGRAGIPAWVLAFGTTAGIVAGRTLADTGRSGRGDPRSSLRGNIVRPPRRARERATMGLAGIWTNQPDPAGGVVVRKLANGRTNRDPAGGGRARGLERRP